MDRISKLFLFLLLSTSVLGSYNPSASGSGKSAKTTSSKKKVIRIVPSAYQKNVLVIQTVEKIRNISFVIADSQGIIKMFGDNYSTGSSINVSHLGTGYYTMFFSKEFNSPVEHFTVN